MIKLNFNSKLLEEHFEILEKELAKFVSLPLIRTA